MKKNNNNNITNSNQEIKIKDENNYLELIYSLSNIISSNFYNLKKFLKKLGNFLIKNFRAKNCLIFLKENIFIDEMRVVFYKGEWSIKEIENLKESIFEKILTLVNTKKKTLFWENENKRFFITTPLFIKDKLLGLILLEIEKKIDYNYLYIFSEIGLLCANAINNIQGYIDKKYHTLRLESLNKICIKLTSLLNEEDIYKETARNICSLLKCIRSSVLYKEKNTNIIKIGYAIGMEEDFRKIEISLNNSSIVRWVFKKGKSIISSSLPQELNPKRRKGYITNSFLIVPIFDSEERTEVIGALCATDRLDKIPFTNEDKALLTFLAKQVGIALTNAVLYKQATVDFLTKLYLRSSFFERVCKVIKENRDFLEPFSLMMLDLDHFKAINDTYGHQVGDEVLRRVGKIIKDSIGREDIAGRYGGEEFIIFLRNKDYKKALKIAEKIRKKVENDIIKWGNITLKITVSIGVTQYIPSEDIQICVRRADESLYKAKKLGRNRVV